jgi:hypothetical protein
MSANSSRSRLTSSGSDWDFVGLAMRARAASEWGATEILPAFSALAWRCELGQLAKLLLRWLAWWMPVVAGGVDSLLSCFLDKGVIVTVTAVPGDQIFILLPLAVGRRRATQWALELPLWAPIG